MSEGFQKTKFQNIGSGKILGIGLYKRLILPEKSKNGEEIKCWNRNRENKEHHQLESRLLKGLRGIGKNVKLSGRKTRFEKFWVERMYGLRATLGRLSVLFFKIERHRYRANRLIFNDLHTFTFPKSETNL